MKKNAFTVLISFISLCGFSQKDYYVSKSGNNSFNGSINSPFLNIQNALWAATAGDNIYVKSGTYAEKLWWTNSGTVGNPITLSNYNDDDVILSGINSSNAAQGALIQISSKSHIRIDGIKFVDNIMNNADGINATGAGTDIQITNCEFSNIGWSSNKTEMPTSSKNAHAIIFLGNTANSYNNILVSDNYVHDCVTGYSESITMVGNIDSFIIQNNTLQFNTNIGIDAAGHFSWTGAPANVNYARNGIIKNNIVSDYDGPSGLDAAGGIYIDGGSFITVENNTVFNYKVGFSVGCEVAGKTNEGNVLQNNLAYNCSLSGLFLGSNTSSLVLNTKIYNNTFYKCGAGTYDNGQIALQNNAGSDIRSNIMYPTNGRYAMLQFNGTTSSNSSIAYNLFWRDNANTNNFFYQVSGVQNSVLSDPLFVNSSNNDFHLTSSSPGINAGDPNYSSTTNVFDIDGESRIYDGRVDIGVDEYNSTLTVNDFDKNEISVYPNPTNGIIHSNHFSDFDYKIYNLNRQVIQPIKIDKNTIDISHLKVGIYLMKQINKNTLKESYTKIIKQ